MFGRVTRVAVSAAFTGAVIVGTNGVGATPWQLVDNYLDPTSLRISVDVVGTVNYTVQYTFDNVFASNYVASSGNWTDHATLTSQTTTKDSNIAYPVRGIRLKQASGTGTTVLTIIQAGGE
jgi:hypothetical protein